MAGECCESKSGGSEVYEQCEWTRLCRRPGRPLSERPRAQASVRVSEWASGRLQLATWEVGVGSQGPAAVAYFEGERKSQEWLSPARASATECCGRGGECGVARLCCPHVACVLRAGTMCARCRRTSANRLHLFGLVFAHLTS
jgi:hypothetical protein